MTGFQKYRKKPVTIKAMQYTGKDSAAEIIRMTTGIREEKTIDSQGNLIPCLLVDTEEGTMQANLGDWIIIGVEGEVYPCKDSVFQATYDQLPADNIEASAEIPQ